MPADETLVPTSPVQPSPRRSRRNLWQRRCGGSGVRRSPLITPVWATVGPGNLPRAHRDRHHGAQLDSVTTY